MCEGEYVSGYVGGIGGGIGGDGWRWKFFLVFTVHFDKYCL